MGIKQVLQVIGVSVALGGPAPARVTHVELERVGPRRSSGDMIAPGGLSRACTLGFRGLKKFFEARGITFDPKIVTSHKGLYCHIFFEPAVKGFRAAPTTIQLTCSFTMLGHRGRAIGPKLSVSIAPVR